MKKWYKDSNGLRIHTPLCSMNKKITPFLFLPVLFLSACASKQDLVVVADDLKKLKTESETIKTQSAGSYSDVQKVHDDISRLEGSIEEAAHKNRQTFARLGMEDSLLVHKVDDLESRLQKIEQYLGIEKKEQSSLVAPKSEESAESAKPAVVTEDALLLKEGLERLAKNSFAPSRESFTALLKKYPSICSCRSGTVSPC